MNKLARDTYLDPAPGPMPFCPGCGHDALLKALDRALVALGRPKNRIAIVTDIGCIGLADRYFDTHAFHGLHGRSITYASGLKLARPELDVIVLMGDGGCGIGGAHLLNVARRNIGITVIVANNFNFGMTGGQHSVTTPCAGRTATTPLGNLESALDICAVAAAAGAGWVRRGTVYDRDLADHIAGAIREPGFALLDVWELCTAYFTPRNGFKKRDVFDLMARSGATSGMVRHALRTDFGTAYRAAALKAKAPRPRPIALRGGAMLAGPRGIVIAGSAGGKVRSAAAVFARAGIAAGLQATQKDDYPITGMTGHSISELILIPEPIVFTAIDSPDYLLVLTGDGLQRFATRIAALPPTSTVIADETLELPTTRARVLSLPLGATARRVSRMGLAMIALGVLLREAALFSSAILTETIMASQKPDVAKANLRALEAGLELAAPALSHATEKE